MHGLAEGHAIWDADARERVAVGQVRGVIRVLKPVEEDLFAEVRDVQRRAGSMEQYRVDVHDQAEVVLTFALARALFGTIRHGGEEGERKDRGGTVHQFYLH